MNPNTMFKLIIGALALFGIGKGIKNTVDNVKRKTYVSFDYEDDKHYKHMLMAWDKNQRFNFYFNDHSSDEINSKNIGVVKGVLTKRIKKATHTLVIVGENANKQHKDFEQIGHRNWINFEIAKSKQNNNKLIAVKLDRLHESPDEIRSSGAEWVYSFSPDAISKAYERF